MAKGLYIDEEEGVVGVIPTPDGGTKGGNPSPKGVTQFPKGGPPTTGDRMQISKCGIRTTESMWTPHKMTYCNAEPGSLLSSTRLENDPQADLDKCQGEMVPKQTSTLGSNEENRFLTDTPTTSKGDEDETVTKGTKQSLSKCHTKGRGVLWLMCAATVLKRWLPLVVLIWVAPPSAAFVNVFGPTSLNAGCILKLRCEGHDAKNLLWWQGLGSEKRSINLSARFEIDGPSRSRPSGVVSTTLKIRNVSDEDSGTYSCYDGKGYHGFQHKVEVLPGISCGSFTPPDDMWAVLHCDHVTVGCKNNSGSWNLQCLNDTWQGQYGPCHAIERPNDCTTQIVVAVVSSTVVIFIGVVVGVVVVVTCKRRRKKRSLTLNSMKEKEKEDCDDSDWVNREQMTVKL